MSKTWFITGAARGIGAAIARAALAAGDKVVATGRDAARIAQTFDAPPDRFRPLPLDVTDAAQAKDAAEAAIARFGRIDVLVNNAGFGQFGVFEENAQADAERVFATNVFGVFNVTRAVLPVMRRQRAGHIFNLSSIGGMRGGPGGSLYAATKFAIEGFSESLAQEVAPFGIAVTIVEPGFFRTDFLDGNSVRYGENTIEDYAEFSAAFRAGYNARSHQQAGDPAKLGAVIVDLASRGSPPLRFAAGSDAVSIVSAKIEQLTAELEAWKHLSVTTDVAAE
jgi:NAD(P)-dependent dehydrogenase (short-subunit alcohol dehydrogenase family)